MPSHCRTPLTRGVALNENHFLLRFRRCASLLIEAIRACQPLSEFLARSGCRSLIAGARRVADEQWLSWSGDRCDPAGACGCH